MPSILGKLNVEKRDARTRYTTRAFEGTLEMSSGKSVDCVTSNENKLVASSRQKVQSFLPLPLVPKALR